jgi:tetratricopeptide (TPR) repeat protein
MKTCFKESIDRGKAAMLAEESKVDRLLLDHLAEVALRNANMHNLSLRIGTDRHFVSRRFKRDRETTLEELELILAAAEMPTDIYLRGLLAKTPHTPPEDVLRIAQEPEYLPPDPLLPEIQPALEKIPPTVRPPRGMVGNREFFKEMDDQRFHDREGTKARIEEFLRVKVTGLETKPVDNDTVGQIVMALGIWATIHRLGGNRNDASRSYRLCFRLCGGGHTLMTGITHHKASTLLEDFGFYGEALAFLDDAQRCYAVVGDSVAIGRAMCDRGRILLDGDETKAGVQTLFDSLSLLPESERRNRFGACQLLALGLSKLGDSRAAQRFYEEALIIEPNPSPQHLASLSWAKARISKLNKAVDQAIDSYMLTARLLENLRQPIKVLLVYLEVSALLLAEKRLDRLRGIGEKAMSLLPDLGRNPVSEAALLSFVRAAVTGAATKKQIEVAAQALKVASRAPARRLRPKPPGRKRKAS